jgi:hypothetical protein
MTFCERSSSSKGSLSKRASLLTLTLSFLRPSRSRLCSLSGLPSGPCPSSAPPKPSTSSALDVPCVSPSLSLKPTHSRACSLVRRFPFLSRLTFCPALGFACWAVMYRLGEHSRKPLSLLSLAGELVRVPSPKLI